jgi:hypothetical protein
MGIFLIYVTARQVRIQPTQTQNILAMFEPRCRSIFRPRGPKWLLRVRLRRSVGDTLIVTIVSFLYHVVAILI